jgi:hypothetical protein
MSTVLRVKNPKTPIQAFRWIVAESDCAADTTCKEIMSAMSLEGGQRISSLQPIALPISHSR